MTSRLRIKICGITSVEDALQAAHQGADAIGLNFYPQSPRRVDPTLAARVVGELPPFVEPVALFVNQPLSAIVPVLQPLGRVRTVQCYGEPRELDAPFPYQLIPAFNVRDQGSLLEISRHLDQCRQQGHSPAAVLADASVPGMYGGTGHTLPWELLADFHPGVPLILAGGLTPENVTDAVRIVRPYAVDVASGVESSPGRKDPEKLRRFIENARGA